MEFLICVLIIIGIGFLFNTNFFVCVGKKLRKIDLEFSIFKDVFFKTYLIGLIVNFVLTAIAIASAIIYGIEWYAFVGFIVPIPLVAMLFVFILELPICGKLFKPVQKPYKFEFLWGFRYLPTKNLPDAETAAKPMYKMMVRIRLVNWIILSVYFYALAALLLVGLVYNGVVLYDPELLSFIV